MNNQCPGCGAVYSVMAHHVGRRLHCKKCAASLVVADAGLQLATTSPTHAEPSEDPLNVLPANPPDSSPNLAAAATASPPLAVLSVPKLPAATSTASSLIEYLTFRRLMIPSLVHAIFWLGSISCGLAGLLTMLYALMGNKSGGIYILVGMALLLTGPVLLRVLCEVALVLVRIQASLEEIQRTLDERPPTPADRAKESAVNGR